jgi:hypothetical protein
MHVCLPYTSQFLPCSSQALILAGEQCARDHTRSSSPPFDSQGQHTSQTQCPRLGNFEGTQLRTSLLQVETSKLVHGHRSCKKVQRSGLLGLTREAAGTRLLQLQGRSLRGTTFPRSLSMLQVFPDALGNDWVLQERSRLRF